MKKKTKKSVYIATYDAILVIVIAVISMIMAYLLMKEDPLTIIIFQGILIWLFTIISQFVKEWEKNNEEKKDTTNSKSEKNNLNNKNHNPNSVRLLHFYNPFAK